jgi:hypothetical protein
VRQLVLDITEQPSTAVGELIHAAVGNLGGAGGLRTKRPGWAE